MGDGTDAVMGMIPTVLAIGILKKTTDMVTGTSAPAARRPLLSRGPSTTGRKISLAEKKIVMRIQHDRAHLRDLRR